MATLASVNPALVSLVRSAYGAVQQGVVVFHAGIRDDVFGGHAAAQIQTQADGLRDGHESILAHLNAVQRQKRHHHNQQSDDSEFDQALNLH